MRAFENKVEAITCVNPSRSLSTTDDGKSWVKRSQVDCMVPDSIYCISQEPRVIPCSSGVLGKI